jgi:hypothetical protein
LTGVPVAHCSHLAAGNSTPKATSFSPRPDATSAADSSFNQDIWSTLPPPNRKARSTAASSFSSVRDAHLGAKLLSEQQSHLRAEDSFAAHLRDQCNDACEILSSERMLTAADAAYEQDMQQHFSDRFGLGGTLSPIESDSSCLSVQSEEDDPAGQVLGGFASLGPTLDAGSGFAMLGGAASAPSEWSTLEPRDGDARDTLDLLSIDEMGMHSVNVGNMSNWHGTRLCGAGPSDVARTALSVARCTTNARKWVVAPAEGSEDERARRAVIVSDHHTSSTRKRDSSALAMQQAGSSTGAFADSTLFELKFLRGGAGAPDCTVLLGTPAAQRRGLQQEDEDSASNSPEALYGQWYLPEARRPSLGKSVSHEALSYEFQNSQASGKSHRSAAHAGVDDALSTTGLVSRTSRTLARGVAAPFADYDFAPRDSRPIEQALSSFGLIGPSRAREVDPLDTRHTSSKSSQRSSELSSRRSRSRSASNQSSGKARKEMTRIEHSPAPSATNGSSTTGRNSKDKRIGDWFRKRRPTNTSPNSPQLAPTIQTESGEWQSQLASSSGRDAVSRSHHSTSTTSMSVGDSEMDGSVAEQSAFAPSSISPSSSQVPPSGASTIDFGMFDFPTSSSFGATTESEEILSDERPKRKAPLVSGAITPSALNSWLAAGNGARRRSSSDDNILLTTSVARQRPAHKFAGSLGLHVASSAPRHPSPLASVPQDAASLALLASMDPLKRHRSIASGMIGRPPSPPPQRQDEANLPQPSTQSDYWPSSLNRTGRPLSIALGQIGRAANAAAAAREHAAAAGLDSVAPGTLTMLIPLPLPCGSVSSGSAPTRMLRVAFVPFAGDQLDLRSFGSPRLGGSQETSPAHSPASSTWYRKLAQVLSHGSSENGHARQAAASAAAAADAAQLAASAAPVEPRRRASTIPAFRVTALVVEASSAPSSESGDAPWSGLAPHKTGSLPSEAEAMRDWLPQPGTFPLVLALCNVKRSLELVPEGWASLGLAPPGQEASYDGPTFRGLDGVADLIAAGCAAVMDL